MLVTLFILGVFIIAQSAITLKMLQAESSPNKNVYNFTMLMLFSGIAMVLFASVASAMAFKGKGGAAPAAGGAPSAAAGSLTAPAAPAAAALSPNQTQALLAQLLKAK
jgi:hypothetical protein